jgi:hypothetical protein
MGAPRGEAVRIVAGVGGLIVISLIETAISTKCIQDSLNPLGDCYRTTSHPAVVLDERSVTSPRSCGSVRLK